MIWVSDRPFLQCLLYVLRRLVVQVVDLIRHPAFNWPGVIEPLPCESMDFGASSTSSSGPSVRKKRKLAKEEAAAAAAAAAAAPAASGSGPSVGSSAAASADFESDEEVVIDLC